MPQKIKKKPKKAKKNTKTIKNKIIVFIFIKKWHNISIHKRKERYIMATENQQEEILKQTQSIIGSVGNGLGTIGETLGTKEGNNKQLEGFKDIAGGVGSISRDVTATVLKAPGAAVETIGNVYGTVLKAPGAAVETITNVGGEIMKAPGGVVKGIGDMAGKGVEGIGNVLGDGVGSLLGKDAGNIVKGIGRVAGGGLQATAGLAGKILQAPGELVKGVGKFAGNVLKMPGELFQGASKMLGKVLKTPGEILQGIGKGHENIVLKDEKAGNLLLNGKKTDLTKDVVSRLGKGNSVWLDGNQLGKMDKFAENMHKLATGKEGQKAPFTNILTKPKGDRADLVKATTENLRSDLHKIKDRLDANPGSFTPKQRKELEVLMDGIEKQGGIDKFMEKNYNLKEPSQSKEKSVVKEMDKSAKEGPKNAKENFEKQFKDIKKDSQDKLKDGKKEFSYSKESTPKDKMKEMTEKAKEGTEAAKDKFKQQFKDIKKDTQEKMKEVGSKFSGDKGNVKPVISGGQTLSMQAPSKSIGGR